jgi:uncharacterized membrane protein
MKLSFSPLKTTLIGGVVFLFPLIVLLYVLGQGVALVKGVAQPLAAVLPVEQVGGIAVVTPAALVLLLLLCYGARLLARAAFARKLSAGFEARLNTLYPRYTVIKAMTQGLHGAAVQKVLQPVLVNFDDHQAVAFDMDRLADGRVVIYLPGAPDVWGGTVVLVASERVQPLAIDVGALTNTLRSLGTGSAALWTPARPAAV